MKEAGLKTNQKTFQTFGPSAWEEIPEVEVVRHHQEIRIGITICLEETLNNKTEEDG